LEEKKMLSSEENVQVSDTTKLSEE